MQDRKESVQTSLQAIAKKASEQPGYRFRNLFGMLNWFYQWYGAERSRVSLDDLAAQQTALFLDGYIASTSGDDSRGNE